MFDICIFLVFLEIECELVGDLGFGFRGDWGGVCVCERASFSVWFILAFWFVSVFSNGSQTVARSKGGKTVKKHEGSIIKQRRIRSRKTQARLLS